MRRTYVTRSYVTRFTFSLFGLGVKLGLSMMGKHSLMVCETEVHVWAHEKLSNQSLQKIKQ